MKKVIVCFVVLALSVTYVLRAQEEDESDVLTVEQDASIGLSMGVEFGIENVNQGKDSFEPYIGPVLIYEKSHFDDVLDVYAELDYYSYFNKNVSHELYFDFLPGYNISLNNASTLSVLLRNENDVFITGSDSNTGILTPRIKFTQSLGFGDMYAQIGAPLSYIGDFAADLEFTLNWQSTFGLTVQFIQHTTITPDIGYAGLDAIISYENGPIYGEVEIDTYKEIDEGMTITPYIEYSFGSFSVYGSCIFAGIVADEDLSISPAIGVKLNF